jgi:ectoine hydroxylase-related dioxygenase (phytanoyl-CoA dioxygenase family)
MIKRVFKNLGVYDGDAPEASTQLERDGWALLPAVFDATAVAEMAAEIEAAFVERQPERSRTDKDEFRYEMFNHSAACQRAIAHPRILEAIEPLLGDDCHVIANTAWKNPPDFKGGPWHCDAGPHVPRPEGVEWDERIPYPVFAIAGHLMLAPCTRADGPTAVIPGSHRSGRLAPFDRMNDETLTYDGRPAKVFEVAAGDVVLFVSDAWHRGRGNRPVLPAGALRAARHRPTGADHRGREPVLARSRRPRRDATRTRPHRSPRPVLLRRLSAPRLEPRARR